MIKESSRYKLFLSFITFFLLIIISLVYISSIQEVYESEGLNDFYKFYLSATESVSGESPYWPAPKTKQDCSYLDRIITPLSISNPKDNQSKAQDIIHPNLNPPAMIAIVKSIANFEYRKAWLIYSIASLICAAASVIIISRKCPSSWIMGRINLSVLYFSYYPCIANIEYGQVAFIILLLLVISWVLFEDKKEKTTGFIVGIIVGLKPFVALFALSFLAARRFKLLVAMFIGFSATILFGGLAVGFSYYKEYISILRDVNWFASSWNASFYGFYTRLFGGAEGSSLFNNPILGKNLLLISCVMVVSLLLWRINSVSKNKNSNPDLGDSIYALTTPAMLLVSPLGWLYYFPLLIVPFFIYFRRNYCLKERRVMALLMILAISLSYLPSFLVSSCQYKSWRDIIWSSSLPFYSLFIIFILSLIVDAKAARREIAIM